MKTKKNLNYLILSIVFLFGLLIGYSPNLAKTKIFHRIHAPIGIELILRLSYLEDAIHYELSVNDFNQKKIEKYKFPYTNRIPIGIVQENLQPQHSITLLLQDKSNVAILYKKDISVKAFLVHYCGCVIFYRGRIEYKEVSDLKKLWKNIRQFTVPSSFLYDRTKMFSENLSF